jgi:hypothetical protein
MADELPAGLQDATTGKNPLTELIQADISARSKWEKIDEAVLKARLVERKSKRSKPYPGAPNFVVPIIDDVTRDKVTQEMNMIHGAQRYAHIIPLSAEMPPEMLSKAEMAFDTYLRHVIHAAPKIEEANDCKVSRGFAALKVIRTVDERWGEVPDFDTRDIRDVIVPANTKELQKAERITEVLRLSPHAVRKMAKERSWDPAKTEEIIELFTSESGKSGDADVRDTLDLTKELIGISTDDKSSKTVTLWECWHIADDWDVKTGANGIRLGEKCCTIFSPKQPETLLKAFAWREEDRVEIVEASISDIQSQISDIKSQTSNLESQISDVGLTPPAVRVREIPGKERKWPYIQARAENRSRYYYDSRGAGRLCMDDQLAATALQNGKMVMQDYFQLPLFTGAGSRVSTNVSYEPGSFLPENMTPVTMPQIPQQFDFDIDGHKRSAGKRVGAGSQYQYSGEISSRRKVQKTATEVQDESMRSDTVSSADVDRFNGPFAELYQQLWEDLARLKKSLPMLANNSFQGMSGPEIYDFPVLIVPASSAKTLSPDTQFQRDTAALQSVIGTLGNLGVVFDAPTIAKDVLAHWDPIRTARWLVDPKKAGPNGELPIYVTMKQIQEGMQAQQEMIKAMQQAIQEVAKMAMAHDGEMTGNRGSGRI